MAALARKLIKESLKTKNTRLDLGKCGLTDLGKIPALFQCTHLETLILSNEWFEWEEGRHKKIES